MRVMRVLEAGRAAFRQTEGVRTAFARSSDLQHETDFHHLFRRQMEVGAGALGIARQHHKQFFPPRSACGFGVAKNVILLRKKVVSCIGST